MSEIAALQRIRRRVRHRRFNRGAVLGNDNNLIYAGLGKVWVRFRAGTDSNGNVTFAPPVKVHRGGATFFEYAGAPVRVVYDENDELAIKGIDNKEAESAGLDSGLLNYGSKTSRWLRLKNVVRLKCYPVGTADDPSTLVSVRSLLYDNDYGDFIRIAATARQADKIDLASYIPTAGNHAVVCVFMRTVANTYQVVSSTVQAQSSDIDITDYQECFAQRDAETVPIQAFILSDAQTSITMSDLGEDLRQFINMPRGLGFPNPVNTHQIIRAGQTLAVPGDVTVTADLTVQGELVVDGRPTLAHVWRDHEPASATVTTGTLLSGTVASVKTMYDGSALHVDEVTGTPGFNIQFGFKDVSTTQPPNFIIARWKYDGSTTHYVTIDMYNYSTTAWDQVRVFKTSEGYYSSMTMYMPNANAGNYVDATGNALCRFYHNTAGNASHDILIDYVGLTYGPHY